MLIAMSLDCGGTKLLAYQNSFLVNLTSFPLQMVVNCRIPSVQVDYEMALEYATQTGVSEEPRETVYIQSLETNTKFIDLQSPVFVFRLFH